MTPYARCNVRQSLELLDGHDTTSSVMGLVLMGIVTSVILLQFCVSTPGLPTWSFSDLEFLSLIKSDRIDYNFDSGRNAFSRIQITE